MRVENEQNRADRSPRQQELRDMLSRVDDIHRAITRAVGRIEYLKLTAERANSSLTPVRYGRGVERSRVEYAVLEADAESWGIQNMQKELEELLCVLKPLVERLPAGLMRAVAVQRIVQGVPCGLIGKKLHFSRAYVYKLLNQSYEYLCRMYERSPRPEEKSNSGEVW